MAAISSAVPVMLRTVSCWPAKLASGRSSAVALERTATGPAPSRSYAATTSAVGMTPSRWASVVTQKPSGIRSPRRISSPNPAALPPTRSSIWVVASDNAITCMGPTLIAIRLHCI